MQRNYSLPRKLDNMSNHRIHHKHLDTASSSDDSFVRSSIIWRYIPLINLCRPHGMHTTKHTATQCNTTLTYTVDPASSMIEWCHRAQKQC